jgi:predicted outer membrane repeat protein
MLRSGPKFEVGMRVVLVMLVCSMIVGGTSLVAEAAGVVGDGTAESCSSSAYAAALAGGGLVTFDCGAAPATIIVDTTLVEEGTILTIDGGGLVTLDGDSLRQLFLVLDGGDLTLRNLSLVHGFAGAGGALGNGGTARLERVNVSLNGADSFGGAAIFNHGVLTVTDSTFFGNTATASGGAIFNTDLSVTIDRCLFRMNGAEVGGAIALQGGDVTVTNSTFDSNGAGDGGALQVSGGTFTLQNATLDQNRADHGGAIFLTGGTLSAGNTVLSRSRNRSGNSEQLECDGNGLHVTSLGGNLVSDGSCQVGGTGDQNNIDPELDAIADNGGPTLTILPLPGSPLIDGGIATGCPPVDQRGFTRPRDGDDDTEAECDVGAVEVPEPAAPSLAAITALVSIALARRNRTAV